MLTGVVIFFLSLLALLAIPVTLSYQISWQQAFAGNINLGWFFGLVRIPVRLPRKKASPTARKVKAHRRLAPRQEHPDKPNFTAFIRERHFRQRLLKFITDTWHAIKKRNIHLRLRIGLGDPAETGKLWAFIGPLSGILANMREVRVEFEPEFFDEAFEMESSGEIRIVPLQIITLILALLLSAPTRRAIRQMRKRRHHATVERH